MTKRKRRAARLGRLALFLSFLADLNYTYTWAELLEAVNLLMKYFLISKYLNRICESY